MPDVQKLFNGVQQARNQGVSDDDIFDHLATLNPGFAAARQQGAKLDDVLGHVADKYMPATPTDIPPTGQWMPSQALAQAPKINPPLQTPPQSPVPAMQKALANGTTGFPPQSGVPGLVTKALNYTGVLPLAESAAHLKSVADTTTPSTIGNLSPAEKMRTGMDIVGMGAFPIAGATMAPAQMASTAALGGAGSALYNESGLAGKVNQGIEKALPNSPYLSEGAKYATQMLAGMAGPGLKSTLSPKTVPVRANPNAETGALLNIGENQLGMEPVQRPKNVGLYGNLHETLDKMSAPQGKAVGAAKTAANEAVGQNPQIGQTVSGAFDDALEKSGVGKSQGVFNPSKSNDPGAAKFVLDRQKQLSDLDNLQDGYKALQGWDKDIQKEFQTGNISDKKSGILLTARKAFQDALDSHLQSSPQGLDALQNLKEARAGYAPMASFKNVIDEAIGGQRQGYPLDAGKFIGAWQGLGENEKASMFPDPQVRQAIDSLTTQNPSLLNRGASLVAKLPNAVLPKFAKIGLIEGLANPKPRFYVPNQAPSFGSQATIAPILAGAGRQ